MKIYRYNETGDLYYLLLESDHTERGERLVTYITKDTEYKKVYSRPISNFYGLVEIRGHLVPRFELVTTDNVMASLIKEEVVLNEP